MIRPLRFWRQYIATTLIFALLLSQTIRVDFFSEAQASQDKYRDIVSIVVDRDTYREIRPQITRYAEDIQSYLGSTRTSILVVDTGTSPAQIAAQNEKFYYEGDGDKGTVSHLIGTVLIGDVAIPMVDAGDEQFPSVYPYVDFVDKKFLYDEASKRYKIAQVDTQKTIEPEIWHGVINPAVGRPFHKKEVKADPKVAGSKNIVSDITQIGTFLDKTHDFYLSKGVFAPSTIPPRVFYYDGYLESKAFALQDIGAYKLYLSSAEEIIYNRYSKYFLQYITSELEKDKAQFETEERAYLDSLGLGAPPISDEFAHTPDIQTKTMIIALLKKFHDLINRKALGDIRGFVRNAGRYNSGSEVRVDQPAINISLMDYSAMNTIRKINDKIEKHIDEVEIGDENGPGQIGAMPAFASTTIKDPDSLGGGGTTRVYGGYIFGQPTETMDQVTQCNIARGDYHAGAVYQQGILVEANKAFDVRSTPESMKNFERDGKKRVDCAPTDDDQSTYKTQAYWGDNIITNVDTTNWIFKKPAWTTGFYEPIFSLGGMNEVTPTTNHTAGGIYGSNIITPSTTSDCYNGKLVYMLQQPSMRADGVTGLDTPWPAKEKGELAGGAPAITCLTKQEDHTEPTWEGNNVPYGGRYPPDEFDRIYSTAGPGDGAGTSAPASKIGACDYGQIAFYLAPKEFFNGGGIGTPNEKNFLYSCLPKYEYTGPIKGETIAKSQPLAEYAAMVSSGALKSKPGPCPSSGQQEVGKLYTTPCPIYGDAANQVVQNGNFRDQYWENITEFKGSLFKSPCAALYAGYNNDSSYSAARNLCMIVEDPMAAQTSEGGDAATGGPKFLDKTTYETAIYRNMKDSRIFHKSPTDEEITAAEKGAVTPSLPIDHDRSVTFAHTVGGEKKITYPNLFRFDEKTLITKYKDKIIAEVKKPKYKDRIAKYGSGMVLILAYRFELGAMGDEVWAGIEAPAAGDLGATPPTPPCWGGAIGDIVACPHQYDPIYGILTDDDIAAVIRSKRWLHPDVTLKYEQAIETGLSYSHQYGSPSVVGDLSGALADIPEFLATVDGAVTGPPKIPTMTGGYEIAYLGLTQFIPKGEGDTGDHALSSGGKSVAGLSADYADARASLTALNISEKDAEDGKNIDPSPSDFCGPPEGVSLFQWPSAIQCWIKSLTPLRITGQACGANSIGLDAGIFANKEFAGVSGGISSLPIVNPTIEQSATPASLATFYAGAKLTYHIPRDVMLPSETLDARFLYTKDGSRLTVPGGSAIHLDIESITDKAGRTIDRAKYSDYLTIAPNPTTLTENGAMFVIQGQSQIGRITLRAQLDIKAADNSIFTVKSDAFVVQVSDEYLISTPSVAGKLTSVIPVTSGSGMVFDFSVRNMSGDTLTPLYPITLDIYDDVGATRIATGIVINANNYTLPSQYTKTPGVIRLEFTDKLGRHSTDTIAVQAGPIAHASLSPISSALLKGSNTLVTLRLRDALGNPITPDLHSIDVTASGGYFVLDKGEKKTSMHIDAIESEIPLLVGSDISGNILLTAKIDDTITTDLTLSTFESARVIISRTGTPQVGGSAIPVKIRITDTEGKTIEGFRSVLSLSLPSGAGTFAPLVASIENGVSESLTYTPGRLAGVHQVKVSVPGLGSIPGIDFSVEAGKPMYISHIEDDTYMTFSLRDRYDNIVPVSLPGTLELGGSTPTPIMFSSGILTVPKKTGYMIVDVPSLITNTISYTDSDGDHTIRGIPTYTAWITSLNKRFDFTADYNARYTVLAGGEFLRESEDILYNTTPGQSSSLAVTTLLDTPYKTDTLMSISPGGGFALTSAPDAIPEATLTLESGYPLLTVRDVVSSSVITRALYQATDATLDTCTGTGCMGSLLPGAHIRLESTASGYTAQKKSDGLNLLGGVENIVSIHKDGSLSYLPGVTLTVDATASEQALVISISTGHAEIAKIYYKTDAGVSIARHTGGDLFSTGNTVILDNTTSTSLIPFSLSRLADSVTGYRFIKKGLTSIIDEKKNGPESIESLAMTSETPGIGWKGTNRMMLSYAGGDTVGEATKWFHTYTLVNLGDPVTHNDHKAPGTELDGIDRSIGTELTSPQASPVKSYAQRDMDKDGYDDIVVQHSDGYIELLLNLGDRIRSRGNIAYVPDLTSRGLSLGDFTHDGYADILGVDKEGSFVMLSNDQRQFTRTKLSVTSGATLPTGVTQFQIRDMDADLRDDIVYLTDGGELSILYGTTRPGIFDKKLLDATLGLSLSATPIKTGGAIYASHIPQVSLSSTSTDGSFDESLIWNEVYTPYTSAPSAPATPVDMSEAGAIASLDDYFTRVGADPTASKVTNTKNFLRSEYAASQGLDISKRYSLGSGTTLHAGQRIRVDIDIHNTSTTTAKSIEYLDTIPQIFSTDKTLQYTIKNNGTTITRDFALTASSDYDAHFTLPDIAAGQMSTISYELTALPTSYGELLVGDYEQGETGADAYMDVGFKTATTCGADMMLWRSDAVARSYTKGTRSFSDATFSATVADQLADTNHDGIPDSVANMTASGQQSILDNLTHAPGTAPSKGAGFIKGTVQDNGSVEIGFDEGFVDEVQGYAKEITDSLAGCGGNAGNTCINYPVNWAPLAPGGDPVAFGYPIGDGFKIGEGLPLFSSFTRVDIGSSPYCVTYPAIWPISPLSAGLPGLPCSTANVASAWANAASVIASGGNTPASYLLGAGGMLGISSAANNFRMYATPTLTMGVGVAMCTGGPASVAGNIPPRGAWPATQGGNCLVVAKNINMCSNDGSTADGDIRNVVGLGSTRDTWNAGNGSNAPGGTNGVSCNIVAQTNSAVVDQAFTQDVISYARAPDKGRLPALYKTISARAPRTSASAGPVLSLNGASSGGAAASVDIGIDSAKPLTFDNIVKLNNKRISGFPDFLMDWVSRQTDELVNSLFTPPSLIIIPPTSIGQNAQFDGTLSGLTSTFKKSYEENSLSNISTAAGKAYDTEISSRSTSTSLENITKPSNNNATSDLGKWINEQQNSFDSLQDSAFKGELGKIADKGKGGLSAIRAAYKLVGKLPLISISEKTVPVDVPWILPQELDKYARSLDAYSKEAKYMIDSFCVNDPSADCLARKGQIQSSGLIGSINENLKRIEEYKNFPIKLQKYITWKQRYLGQILCYITTIQQMTTGWLKDNSIRFKKWAELIVLMRTIAESWQPILDILNEKDAQCSVCHNERYNAKYWKYKLISMLIPSIPVIQFPRWPDIVLDLSDIRFAILISMPNFQFNLKPIRLPSLPSLSLPRGPNVSLSLPAIPVLPPIPVLPDLPDLPSLPTIKLPNLPPPPKLPKILGALSGIVKLLKLYKMMECYLNKTPYVPEWTVGDVIAQRTERQGTLPMDFIDISLPQISIPTIKEIRISTHVNFEIRSDFVTEFARAAVAPLNQFGADLGRAIPAKIAPDVNLSTPTNINLNNAIQSSTHTWSGWTVDGYIADLERDRDVLLDTDTFATYLTSEITSTPELAHLAPGIAKSMEAAALDSKKETDALLAYHASRYDLLRDYVSAQYDETANMQHIIDLLSKETHTLSSTDDIDRALMVSETLQSRSSEIARNFNSEPTLTTPTEDHPTDSLHDVASTLAYRVVRLAANSSDAISADQATIDTAAGYTPNFQGIYIVTENGTQTRLFDYTETLQKTDVSTKVDIDRDGDMDYLYLLDGALFLKRTTTRDPTHTVDRTTTVKDITQESPIPSAADFFHEDVSLPNTLTLSYHSAVDTESVWRVDFYDRYLEWDMLDQGQHDETKTPRQIVELYRQDTGTQSPGEKSVLRSLERVTDPTSLVIEGPKMVVLTGAQDFTLSPGRTLYTGNQAVTIRYSTGTTGAQIEKKLEAHRGYSFAELANVSLDSGTLYIVYPSIVSERYTYSPALIGMPILPGMHLTSSLGEVILRDLVHDDDIVLSPKSLYHSESITRLADEYSAEIPYPNGYYYARIQNLDGRDMTIAREALFTPQASSDTSAPDLDIRDTIRVPVYQSRDIPLQSIITETNPYTLKIDPDISQDSDGNGVYDDDFVTTALGVSVTPTTLTLGSYDTIGKRDMMFQVVDEYHNTTLLPVSVEIYAPIPFVSGITASGTIGGGAGESLLGEPIHLFRVRTGTDIQKLNTGALLTTSGGLFQSADFTHASGAILSVSGQKIPLSDHGIFASLPSGYTSRVVLADTTDPLHIEILDARGAPVYRQMIVLPEAPAIIDDTSGTSTGTDMLAISPASGYVFVSAGVSDPSIPGGYYLVDSDKHPLLAIARDGNIYPIATGITATFSDKNGYPNLIVSSGGKRVAELLYKFDFFYTLK